MQTDKKPHLDRKDWLITPDGNPRGYIDPAQLKELWFHTGTACNLSCSFCLEGSKPGDTRIESISFPEAKAFIDEAMELGVQQFSFTGGEPFVTKDMIAILDYALDRRPCHVLTNGTAPLNAKLDDILKLKEKPNTLSFRVSIDYPDAEKHDKGRGQGNFMRALKSMKLLHDKGFHVSVARQSDSEEDGEAVRKAYEKVLSSVGLPSEVPVVSFPDLLAPGSNPKVPYVTEGCMTQYQDEKSRSEFMCGFSKMVLKKDGKMRVYACTLVDDDPDYDMGSTLNDALKYRVMLKHHRCYACFAYGTSCSEQNKELSTV